MKRFFIAVVFLSFGLALPAVGQVTSEPVANTEAKGDAIALNEEQKQAVIDAAVSAKSRQKTPKEFSPTLGATMPKEVYLHGFTPDETQKTPLLKECLYAFLDREIILVGGAKNKIVAVIALPEKLVATGQVDQGAAQASGTNAKGDDDATSKGDDDATSTVPSHTSPESIK